MYARGRERGAGAPVEDGEELGPAHDEAVGVAMVGARIADDLPDAIDGAVGGLARDFGAAVAVEVVDDELRVVRALADVLPEVDAPEEGAVEPVGLEDRDPS